MFCFSVTEHSRIGSPENILNGSPTGTVISYWTRIYYNRDLTCYFTTAEQGRQLQRNCSPQERFHSSICKQIQKITYCKFVSDNLSTIQYKYKTHRQIFTALSNLLPDWDCPVALKYIAYRLWYRYNAVCSCRKICVVCFNVT